MRAGERLLASEFDVWWDRVSMPSRQFTFHQEIADAIRGCERLLLVVGPQAAGSDHVRQEWRWALELDKAVTPVLRSGDYGLPPDELKLLHCEDFRDDAGLLRAVGGTQHPVELLTEAEAHRLLAAAAGVELVGLRGHTAETRQYDLSPDGRLVASVAVDGAVRVWDAESGQELACLVADGNPLFSVAFAPCGSRLATGSCDGMVRWWDLADGSELACLRGHPAAKDRACVQFGYA